jgi:hypothetical protein
VSAAAPPAKVAAARAAAAAPVRAPGPSGPIAWLASMRLAVVLVVLLGLLTWLGTLAQIDRSTFDVQREYFESWYVLAELPLSWWGRDLFTLVIPLPGAYPVMGLLGLNLLVGGLVRLRLQAKNAGVLITHIGILLLLVAGFVKLHFSFAGHLALYEAPAAGAAAGPVGDPLHESSTFVSFHDYELALLKDLGDSVEERVVPEASLWAARPTGGPGARRGRLSGLLQSAGLETVGETVVLRAPDLPFTVQVHHWFDNCRPTPKGPMVAAETPVVDGAFLRPVEIAREREQNTAGCYVTVLGQAGERVEGILWGLEMRPFEKGRFPLTFTIAGQRWGLDLRRVMYELPFGVRLDKFQKSDHPGTTMARDFRSFVTVQEPGRERQVQIYMNTPLRQDGYVVYQTNWGPQQGGGPPWYSVFEIANNPSDVWPAVACGVIALGLLVHFVTKLARFLSSSSRKALQS